MLNTPESKSSAGHHDNKKISVSTSVPESISLDKWADSGFQWAGEVNPQGFKRLSTILTAEREQAAVQLDIDLYHRNNVLHIAFTLTGEVWLTCQRCLQPVVTDLSDDYDIALLENDSQASLLDEEQDYLMLDEVITESAPEQLLPFKKLL
ncbi:MAG: YceD family protein, partial [Psychrobacter sp.]